jgi:hypothetical protein
MLTVRRSEERGQANLGWLNSRHTFSFADYFDPEHVEFGVLRVINEDRVKPGTGFGTHGHRDMEILSYVLEGQLEHRDSMGNSSVIRPGDVQRMSAGRGVMHSETNPSRSDPVHFLQIWIKPNALHILPSYEQKSYPEHEKRGRLRLVASETGAEDSVRIHQDVRVFAGLFDEEELVTHEIGPDRRAYVHIARGSLTVNGKALSAGDGLKIMATPSVTLSNGHAAEVIVFDLPA